MMPALLEFHFLRPLWLLALLALPVLLWAWQRREQQSDPWRAACDPHLLPHLLQSSGEAGSRLPRWLFAAGFALAVLALSGPAFRQASQPLARAESALVVALDLSDRMRATDLEPTRVARARFKLADLLRSRREGQTALVAYAGDAFTVAPLTDDAQSLGDLLAALTPDTMPEPGQRADRAIDLAAKLLRDGGFARGELLLVTDNADARASAAAANARRAGLQVSVLGVGTAAGAPIDLPQGGFLQDEDGNVLLPRLEEAALRAVAAAGGGRYATLRPDRSDLAALALGGMAPGDAELREDERRQVAYRDEGPWLVLALLPLAAFGFRRGWLGLVLVALLLPTPRAEAFDWSGLWQREDQRAWRALHGGENEQARALAQDPAVRGSAAYRGEDYAQAAADFAQADDADAHYNRGNALARAKRYQDAIAAYDEALKRAPEMEDARANRKAVEEFLQQQKSESEGESESGDPSQSPSSQQPGEPQESEQKSSGDTEASEQAEGESSQQANGEQQADSAPAEPGDEAQQEQAQQQFSEEMKKALEEAGDEPAQQASGDPRKAEQQQAVEQWLRRVPDDPGGLLRRKFALEHQRRRRAEEGR
jgi:Ca-activated chloride channel homolog